MEHYGLQSASGHLHVPAESKEPYPAEVLARLHAEAEQVIARYPVKRSALLPLLHLVQSVDGYITGRGIEFCAEVLELSTAQVSGVATFYTQYKRHPNGEYTVGVCTNTLCAIMGGDEIWSAVSEHLGIGHDETTADGKITLERIECNAACDFAPVVMANWEFFDNQTPQSTVALVDDLVAGNPVTPTRGPNRLGTFKETSRVLAGFLDDHADEGPGAGPASLVGLELARAAGWSQDTGATSVDVTGEADPASAAPAGDAGPAVAEGGATPASDTPDTAGARGSAEAADERVAVAGFASLPHAADTHAPYGEGSAAAGPGGVGPEGWTIKGNADSGLYHTPESPWFKRTIAEVWFQTEDAARAAGFTDARERRRKAAKKEDQA